MDQQRGLVAQLGSLRQPGSGLVYTCGTRDRQWTIEAIDWTTGESRFHYSVGGSQFNTLGAGVIVDDDGRLLYGNVFGKTRITRTPEDS